VHSFAGTTTAFFSPALTASLWLLGIQKLLSEILHVTAVLYVHKSGCVQIKLDPGIIYNFFFG
jgi:hypothetical protein